jgi:hypothetical protein
MFSTVHTDKIVNIGKLYWKTKLPILKPKCIVDYSSKIETEDQINILLSYVLCIRKSARWYKKLALHILDVALHNVHALYLLQNFKRMPLQIFKRVSSEGSWNIYKEVSSWGGRCSSGEILQHLTVTFLIVSLALLAERVQWEVPCLCTFYPKPQEEEREPIHVQ